VDRKVPSHDVRRAVVPAAPRRQPSARVAGVDELDDRDRLGVHEAITRHDDTTEEQAVPCLE